MSGRADDTERAVLQVGATRSHSVVVVKALLQLGLIEQRLMRDRRAPANVTDVDRARLIGGSRRETRHVNRERQVSARSTFQLPTFSGRRRGNDKMLPDRNWP